MPSTLGNGSRARCQSVCVIGGRIESIDAFFSSDRANPLTDWILCQIGAAEPGSGIRRSKLTTCCARAPVCVAASEWSSYCPMDRNATERSTPAICGLLQARQKRY